MTFRAGNPVTRGQLATMISRGKQLPSATSPTAFRDVRGSVHADAIAAATEAGIISGYPDGTFRPGAVVTRAQAATMLVRTMELGGTHRGGMAP